MLRFIDWLWYSDEGQTLCLWGVEGETYTKDANGTITLNPDIYFNGINPGAEKSVKRRLRFRRRCVRIRRFQGVTVLQISQKVEKEWNERIDANKENAKSDASGTG